MLKWLQYHIRSYFGFTRKQTDGTIALMFVLLAFLLFSWLYPKWMAQERKQNLQSDKNKLDSLVAIIEQQQQNKDSRTAVGYKNISDRKGVAEKKLFSFDPNTASAEELQQLGIYSSLANRIVNYRNKGGVFRTKNDLLKIYGFPDRLYTALFSYINLPERLEKKVWDKNYPTNTENKREEKKVFSPNVFDINRADTNDLKSVKGIGSVYANRIIKYRNKLGGFVASTQLKEVYGLNDTLITQILKQARFEVNPELKQININTADVVELKEHPYIKYKLAQLIVSYRSQHGNYNSVEEIKNIKVIKEEDFTKLKPYLIID